MFDFDIAIVEPDQEKRAVDTVRTPFPVLGLATRVYTGRLSLGGELTGLTLGKKGTVYEVVVSTQLHVSDRLAITGGYRLVHVRGESAPDSVFFEQKGWRFGAELDL